MVPKKILEENDVLADKMHYLGTYYLALVLSGLYCIVKSVDKILTGWSSGYAAT